MTETKHKEHITSEHFGIPADFADRAENYAAWRVQTLSEQLAEAQALIDASRNQEPPTVEFLTDKIASMLGITYHCTRVWSAWGVGTMGENDFEPVDESDTPREIAEEIIKLFATPVVAPDVMKAAQDILRKEAMSNIKQEIRSALHFSIQVLENAKAKATGDAND